MDDKILSFYEAVHQKELEYKETLMSRVQITAALFVINGSAFVYMLRNLDLNSEAIFIHYFILFAALNSISLCTAAYFLMRAFSSSEYKSLPTLDRIDNYISELNKYNEKITNHNSENNTNEPTININEKISEYLKNTYIECATFNALANERRSSFSYRSVVATLTSFSPLFICSILFIADDMDAASARKPTDITAKKIEISLEKIHQSLQNSNKVNVCPKIKNNLQNLQFHLQLQLPESLEKVTYLQSHRQKKEMSNACIKTKQPRATKTTITTRTNISKE